MNAVALQLFLGLAFGAAEPSSAKAAAATPPATGETNTKKAAPAAETAKGADAKPAANSADAPAPIRLRKRGQETKDADKPGAGRKPALEEKAPEVPDRNIPKPPAKKAANTTIDDELLQDLGGGPDGVDAEDADPLLRIGRRMRTLEERLAKLEANDETVDLQKKVVADLDELLKQKCEQCNSSNSNSKNSKKKMSQQQAQKQQKPDGQAKNSTEGTTQASRARAQSSREDPTRLREIKDVWGHLSAMMRQEMNQYAKESFLPQYRELLERYYTTIAAKSKNKSE